MSPKQTLKTMTGFDTIAEMRETAEKHQAIAQMQREIAELAEYLNDWDNVVYSDVANAEETVFVTVHVREVTGTINDMIGDYRIFGNGKTDEGHTEFVFEVQPYHFMD